MQIGWMTVPPYIYRDKEGDMAGPLVDIVHDALSSDRCCQNYNNMTIEYADEINDYSDLVEKSVNSSFDMVLPIRTSLGKDFYLAFPFINLGKIFEIKLRFSVIIY